MVTIGTAFGEIEDELENMLDMIAEALDHLDAKETEEALNILVDLEDRMLTFLDYEEVDEGETDSEPAANTPAPKPKSAGKPNNKPKAGSKYPAKNSSKPKSAGKPKSKKSK